MDDKPYQEISSDKLSSILSSPCEPVIIIGPDTSKTRRVVLYPYEHHHLWADAYDEHGNSLDDIIGNYVFLWACSRQTAIEILPITYGLELGIKSSREVYLLIKDEPGIYTITAEIDYKGKVIQGSFEVEIKIMDKTQLATSKGVGSPSPCVAKDTQQTAPTQIITAEFKEKETQQESTALVPAIHNEAHEDIDIERRLTKTDITISETSLEERKRQQRALASKQKPFIAKAADMANPITNVDTYVATMSYICFATGIANIEKGNYTAGALFLICFAIFAIAKQGLPEGVFTQWLKQRSQTTVQNIHKTLIGDK